MSKWMLILVSTAMSASAGLSRIEALGMIETGNNDRLVGQAGEVSRFQIRPEVWNLYSQSSAYGNFRVASGVAQQHLQSLEMLFRARTGREPTDFDLYVLWNAGAGYYERVGFEASRVGPVIRDRAQRYANLCESSAPKPVLYASGEPRSRFQPKLVP